MDLTFSIANLILIVCIIIGTVYYCETIIRELKQVKKALKLVIERQVEPTIEPSEIEQKFFTLGLKMPKGIEFQTTIDCKDKFEAVEKWLEVNALDKTQYDSKRMTYFDWAIVELDPTKIDQVQKNREDIIKF